MVPIGVSCGFERKVPTIPRDAVLVHMEIGSARSPGVYTSELSFLVLRMMVRKFALCAFVHIRPYLCGNGVVVSLTLV